MGSARSLEAVLTAKATHDYRAAGAEFPGATLRHFGSRVVATRLPALADLAPYNKVRGFGLDHRRHLRDVVSFYDETGQRPSVEVWAQDDSPDLRRLLRDEGLAPTATSVLLQVRPRLVCSIDPPGVQVHEVDATDPRYLGILTSGYGVPPESADLRRMTSIEHSTPGLRRYLATVDGRPAAAGALLTSAGASLLVGAATLPVLRKRGAQAALVRRRLRDAAADSDVVVVTAAERSTSHSNLMKLGFSVAHTRTLWRNSPCGVPCPG